MSTWKPTVVSSSIVFTSSTTRQVSRYAIKKKKKSIEPQGPGPGAESAASTQPRTSSSASEYKSLGHLPTHKPKPKTKPKARPKIRPQSTEASELSGSSQPFLPSDLSTSVDRRNPDDPPAPTAQFEEYSSSSSEYFSDDSDQCSDENSPPSQGADLEIIEPLGITVPVPLPSSPEVAGPSEPEPEYEKSVQFPFTTKESARQPQSVAPATVLNLLEPEAIDHDEAVGSSLEHILETGVDANGTSLDADSRSPTPSSSSTEEVDVSNASDEIEVTEVSYPVVLQQHPTTSETQAASIPAPVVARRQSRPKTPETCEWLKEGVWSLVNSRTESALSAVVAKLRRTEPEEWDLATLLYGSVHRGLAASSGDTMWYSVQTREGQTEVYDVLRRALEPLGWRQTENGSLWNLLWTWQQPVVEFNELLSIQRVNHFRENKHLTRKDYLKRSQDRYVRFSKSNYFRIYPDTFILPKDYTKLIEAFADKPDVLYIMKPVSSSRGRGVKLISELSEISYSSACIVQRYIHRPVLYKGFKFDLRIYVLVTSFGPTLQAYIHKQGFARLATVQYSLEEQALKNKLVHVTNVAVQSANADKSVGTKLSLEELKYCGCFGSPEVFDDIVWPRIKEAAIKALLFASHNVPCNINSFELFGFDMLVERDSLRVWVLEVNSSPSMSLDTQLDQTVKVQLIRDTVLLVDPIKFDRDALQEVLEKRRNTRIDRTAKLSAAEAGRIFCGKAYSGSYPESCEPTQRRLGDFEVLAPSPLYDKVAHEARNVVNPGN